MWSPCRRWQWCVINMKVYLVKLIAPSRDEHTQGFFEVRTHRLQEHSTTLGLYTLAFRNRTWVQEAQGVGQNVNGPKSVALVVVFVIGSRVSQLIWTTWITQETDVGHRGTTERYLFQCRVYFWNLKFLTIIFQVGSYELLSKAILRCTHLFINR